MYTLPVRKQLQILKDLIHTCEQSLESAPEGNLLVCSRGPSFQYYCFHKQKRTYLPRSESLRIHALAQKDYDSRFLQEALHMQEQLLELSEQGLSRSAQSMYSALASAYENLSPQRKTLVHPYVLPDAEFIAQWLAAPYTRLGFSKTDPVILSEHGERVRSKSEKIITDKYCLMGIPYRNDVLIELPGFDPVYADLQLLDIRERTTVLHEHFGLMLDPKYCRKNLARIDTYNKCGYVLGRDILYTFEGGPYVLDSMSLDTLIRARFLL